ncbi:MAG TPA: 23S rRNA (pseudouridine(1915)-N(3))-methyltransferase RlmH [Candidatus Acidoferrum sp.]|nr:23S rRNA (pseudouridine(1915)-N(3))-methyltransferase RlmH [Candidatus Acidoferrum sp.]
MKIRLLMLGKTRRTELRAVIDDYVKRVSRHSPIEVTEVRDGEAAIKKLDADRAAPAVLLDAFGKNLDSNAFAKWLGELRDRGTRELIFVCGDADGFPAALRERVPQKISLSAMTYSHELARAMLAEQLYRAFAILSGSPYPK